MNASVRLDEGICLDMSEHATSLRKLLLAIITVGIAYVLLTKIRLGGDQPTLHRDRRHSVLPALVFPSGTVFQINIAVQTPVPVPNKTVAISLGLQMNFVLPTNITEFRKPIKMRPKRESLGEVLLSMYLPFEAFLEEYGFDGRTCILKCICEAAQTPFLHEDSELWEEIAHSVLTPSEEMLGAQLDCNRYFSSSENKHDGEVYLAAECLGKFGGNCFTVFADCPNSPLDLISNKITDELLHY